MIVYWLLLVHITLHTAVAWYNDGLTILVPVSLSASFDRSISSWIWRDLMWGNAIETHRFKLTIVKYVLTFIIAQAMKTVIQMDVTR